MQPQQRPKDDQNRLPQPYRPPQREADPNSVPPNLIRQVSDLSDPARRDDDYVMAPPTRKQPSLASRAADITVAAISHFAIAFGFFGIGFLLSIAISAGIWLYSKRSPFVEYHSRQAGYYQCFVLIFNAVYVILLAVLGGFSLFDLIGAILHGTLGSFNWAGNTLFLVLLALGVIWFFFSILYGIFGGIMVMLGKDFRYPLFGRP